MVLIDSKVKDSRCSPALAITQHRGRIYQPLICPKTAQASQQQVSKCLKQISLKWQSQWGASEYQCLLSNFIEGEADA
eukprot:scaffold51239_cov22-Tisochrysis_lutea.AAC.1